MATPTPAEAMNVAGILLGRRPDRLEPFAPQAGGDDSHSFRLWVRSDPMLLQIRKRPGRPMGVYFHNRLRLAGVPVPDLIVFDPAAGPAGQACAIWEWIDGAPATWGANEPCPYDEAQLGHMLRRIHDLRCDRPYGLLGDDPAARPAAWPYPGLGPVSESWSRFFDCSWAAEHYQAKGYIDSREAAILRSLPDRLAPQLNCVEPRLLHMGDIMHNGNLIVDPQTRRILAVIDHADSTAGDPRWELAWFDYYFGQYPFDAVAFDMTRFRAGYGTEHNPDDAPGRFYLLAILLFEKLLFFDPASPRGRWAIETVKEILASFGRSA